MNYDRGDVVIVPFARRLGRLSDGTMKEIDKRLKLSLGIKN
jgi:mRNA-degrading endonuclease toxin of MazEF toxin-antitoxin module